MPPKFVHGQQVDKPKYNYTSMFSYLACGSYQQVHQGSVSHGQVLHWNIPADHWPLVATLHNPP